eukprot:351377-Chlamydomonas_euryale.AAC.3
MQIFLEKAVKGQNRIVVYMPTLTPDPCFPLPPPALGTQATKLFVSNLNARLAQRFLALVLLPRLRNDIKQDHKLHPALFQAMRKAAYKPGAFYKVLA